jgi:hypothetical protein
MVLASVKRLPLNCTKLYQNPDCEMNVASFMAVGQVDFYNLTTFMAVGQVDWYNLASFMAVGQVDWYNLMGGFRTADKIARMQKN